MRASGVGSKRPLPATTGGHDNSMHERKRPTAVSILPPLPLRHPQPAPPPSNGYVARVAAAPHLQHRPAATSTSSNEGESLQDEQDWAFIMQQMAAADAPHLQEEEDYDQILPSCPIVVSEEPQPHDDEEDPSLLLGADISESTWLGDEAEGGGEAGSRGGEDEDDGDHDDEDEEEEGSLWGLPPAVAEILGQRGITQFYGITSSIYLFFLI